LLSEEGAHVNGYRFAWPAGRDGRKLTAGSALIGPGGTVLAAAR
jgi:hypothetical protein